MNTLPIDAVLPELLAGAAETPNLVLAAPPGAGKTTGVPPALLSCSWTRGRRILLLQPRRLVGDEPEPLETVLWPLDRLEELALNGAISDARTLAALFVARGALSAARDS